jgi:pimeloyl-ACP methyl ester carboxylesterase
MNRSIDVRPLLGRLEAPTLVVNRIGDRVNPIALARYLAGAIPGAALIELPGDDHLPFLGDAQAIIDAVRLFLERNLAPLAADATSAPPTR